MELKQITLLFKKKGKSSTGAPRNSFEKDSNYNNEKGHFSITNEVKIKTHREILKHKIAGTEVNCNLFIMDDNWYQIDRTNVYDRLTTFVFATEIDGGIYNETEIN